MFVWNKFFVCLCLGFPGLGSVSLGAEHGNGALVVRTLVEINDAVGQCVQRVVLALGYILTGEMLVATLTNDDVAGGNALSTSNLNT